MFGRAGNSGECANMERRAARRFPVALQLQYRAFRNAELLHEGSGRTVNMSSGGILLCADVHLEPGMRLEISVAWPVLDERKTHLQLLGAGEVVRTQETDAAIRIRRHEFRVDAPRH